MRLFPCLFTVFSLLGQSVRVYSEFVQFDRSGMVLAPKEPREILSPAIPRNGFTSLQINVQVASGQRYFLYVRQNPQNALHVMTYREEPEGLQRAVLPFHGSGPEVFWMDLRSDPETPTGRVKVEVQIRVGDEWCVYPMEIQVISATIPDGQRPDGSAAPAEVMRNFLCGGRVDAPSADPLTRSRLQFRNAQQDIALATTGKTKDILLDLMGGCETPLPEDPESYLRLRDYLFRAR